MNPLRVTTRPRFALVTFAAPRAFFFTLSSQRQNTAAIMDSLRVHNSLKPGAPVPFTPMEPGKVSWYVCGPTVYDKSHLGHARNYVASDIIRRIMMHYFGFDVKYVMNMTDVDDKV
jgi:cysteinyl-tRNA synthetase